ncbi:hypothetical protein [Clostridium ihumii]|uniref:hypothetical protein n=1 Tax=Clostridium ihumii TaxID=1470356 RepID=UPI003D32AC1A
MKKIIPGNVKEAVLKVTEVVLEEIKEVDVYKIKEILEKEYRIKFFNSEILQKLIQESLNKIVFIYW